MKVFIITLKGMPEIEAMAKIAFDSANAFGYEPEILTALTGATGRKYLSDNNIKPLHNGPVETIQQQQAWLHRDGTIGCFASHHHLWSMCVKLNEDIIILEQDTQMLREWSNPDFKDVLHLDCHGALIRRKPDMGRYIVSKAPIQEGVFELKFLPVIYPNCVMNGNYCYAIKPHAAQKLIDDVTQNGWFAADRVIREPLMSIETINPPIAQEQQAATLYSTSSLRKT